MLDVLKLKISTKFMKGFVAKMLSKKMYEKSGCKVDIRFRDIEVDTIGDDIIMHIDGDVKLTKTEFERFLKSID